MRRQQSRPAKRKAAPSARKPQKRVSRGAKRASSRKPAPQREDPDESDEESTDDEDSDDDELEKWEERLMKLEGATTKELEPKARQAPHLVTKARPVPYQLVIPTYQRWMPVCQMSNKKRFKGCKSAFILVHTLAMLSRQRIPKHRVTLFVANETERKNYRDALVGSEWENVRIELSVKGNKESRNFIMKFFPAGTYVVSIDDDVERISWKIREGMTPCVLRTLPPGSLEKVIFDAYRQMKAHKAYLWGVSTSQNARHMKVYGLSKRNGLVNGYLNGYISRPKCKGLFRTLTDATEDSEFAVRHYAKDGVVLRYRMYAGITSPYLNRGGLQKKFEASGERITAEQRGEARKKEERWGAMELHKMFPQLVGPPKKRRDKKTMEVNFHSMGYPPGEGGKRKRIAPRFMDADLIRYRPENPKLWGCHAYKLYESYKRSKTLREAVRLGARPIDLAHDYNWGFLTVRRLSLNLPWEVEIKERPPPAQRVGFKWAQKPRKKEEEIFHKIDDSICRVRIKDMSLGHQGLTLPKKTLIPLARRVPQHFRKLELNDLTKEDGPLSSVPMVVLRSLLRWISTGSLRYLRKNTKAVHTSLKALGFTQMAKKVKQREAADMKLAEDKDLSSTRSLGRMARAAASKRRLQKQSPSKRSVQKRIMKIKSAPRSRSRK